jgi:hypothetical protein
MGGSNAHRRERGAGGENRSLGHCREQAKVFAADGRFELFKTTKKYDGSEGRQQHHFPPSEDLPA